MLAALVLVAARLRGQQCSPAPALMERNMCVAYDNECAGSAGFGGALLQVPTVDASKVGFMTSREFVDKYVNPGGVGTPLLLKNASHFFLRHPELFTQEGLTHGELADKMIDTTSSGREVANREQLKSADDPLIPLKELFENAGRSVFFQAWKIDMGRANLTAVKAQRAELHRQMLLRRSKGKAAVEAFKAQRGSIHHHRGKLVDHSFDHLDRPREFKVEGDESFSVSKFAFEHVKREHGLFEHSGYFNFLMAHEGGVLPHSHAAVLNVLTQGAKRWTLVSPAAYASPVAQDTFEDWNHTQAGTSYLSQQWYTDHSTDIKDVPHYDFVQEQGDAVFFPLKYTHATVDLCAPTVAFIQKGDFRRHVVKCDPEC